MAFTKRNKAAVKALVSCHETGKPVGNYSALVVLTDDAGITYGCHQATHKSGTIHKIVKMYCDISNSEVSKRLEPYIAGFKNPSLRHKYAADKKLKNLLIQAGEEPAMRFVQDKVFEVNYLEPAIQAVLGSGWTHPLSLAVVYDSMIQGGWTRVRDRVKGANEKTWIKKYVAARRKWLLSSSRPIVRKSVYRMATFERLIANGNWFLDTPFLVHGVKVNDDHLAVWIASDNPNRDITESGEAETINIEPPAPNYFNGNTEGLADDNESGGSWDEGIDIDDTKESYEEESVNTNIDSLNKENEQTVDIVKEESESSKNEEPITDVSSQEGEVLVGGRPQDSPIILEKPKEVIPSGWKTWPTTVTATLSGIGLSVGGIITSVSGIELSPALQSIVGWIIIVGLVVAAGYTMFYLVYRMITRNREAQRAHEIALKELELRSMPNRYNVKLDRRNDTSNINLPIEEKRQ